ncbi:MAG TPA: rod shape-determining protein MreD [Longimicrobiales bacterium]|nr:rod shape-determining protein MreD [Longimicrobiales bacterium]
MAARSPASFWVFFVLLVITHFMLHLAFGLPQSAPDLLTAALLLGVRRMRASSAALLGLVLGLINDALSPTAFGADTVVMTVIGYLGAWSRDLFEGDSLLFVGVYLFIGKWLHDFIYWLLARDLARGDALSQLFLQGPATAAYTAVGGIVALLIYRASSGDR